MRSSTGKSRIDSVLGAVAACGLLILGGCATETTKKPDVTSGAAVSAPRSKAPPAKSDVSSRQTQSGSSLDALRAGKPPAEGPLKNVYFEFDSYALSADARGVLKTNAEWLKANPSVSVEIEGHCDERGTTDYNLALGAKRARAALDYLVALGVSAARLKTTSYGEEVPVCREKSDDCYAKNRRDRFAEMRVRPGA
jgi:peptidoglycan-associated lipoprotein